MLKKQLIIFCLLIMLPSCSKQDEDYYTERPEGFPETLIAPEGSYGHSYYFSIERYLSSLSFGMDEDHPADNTLKIITENLEKNGFRKLKYDLLNPTIPSSDVRGWTFFEDSTQNSSLFVHQWLSQWIDNHNNIVRVVLLYVYPKDSKQNLETLRVSLMYTNYEMPDQKSDIDNYFRQHPEEKQID